MSAQVATFDHDPGWAESLKTPFVRSMLLHLGIVGAFIAYGLMGGMERFGAQDAGGAVVGVEAVKSIPLPSRGETNPVAHDTPSITPPKPVEKAAPKARPEKPPPDAIAIEKSKAKTPPPPAAERLKPFDALTDNQLTSKSAPALSNPMFSVAGSGQIGVSQNTTLGTRCPGYAAQIREIVQRNWRTADIPAAIKSAPRVTVEFLLLRDGGTRDIKLTQRSNIAELDFSVQRAIQASTFPSLPRECEKESVDVEFNFELRR